MTFRTGQRAFFVALIRAYAHAIGLEPDVVVREFLERHPDPIEVVAIVSAIAPGVDGAREESFRPRCGGGG